MTTPDLPLIIRQFFPGAEIGDIAAYGSGHINDTYRIRILGPAGEEAYLLQRLNHEVFRSPERVMHNIARVYEHLSTYSDEHCLLRPLSDPNGRALLHDAPSGYWRVFPFFSGTFSVERAENLEQAEQAARVIGRFLQRLSDLDPAIIQETIPDFHNSLRRWDIFQDVLARNVAGRAAASAAEIELLTEHHPLFRQIAELSLPRRVVHNDAKLSNVLFYRPQTPCGLIDWDTIMPGSWLSDFGDLVRSAAATTGEDADPAATSIDLPTFTALCRGFIPEIRPRAAAAELEHLVLGPLWITLEQALRFLTDYLDGDRYYKIHFPEHNLLRTRNQLALFQSMWNHRQEMTDIIQSFI